MRITSIDAIPVAVPKPHPSTSALGTFRDSYADPPEGPGLGVEPDWERIEAFRVRA